MSEKKFTPEAHISQENKKSEPKKEVERKKFFRSCQDCAGGTSPEWSPHRIDGRCGACDDTGKIEISEKEAQRLRSKDVEVWDSPE